MNKYMSNTRRKRPGTTSQYRGVCRYRATNTWAARMTRDSDNKPHLGYYDSEEEAARAYDAAVRYYFGVEFAFVNFPGDEAVSAEELRARCKKILLSNGGGTVQANTLGLRLKSDSKAALGVFG